MNNLPTDHLNDPLAGQLSYLLRRAAISVAFDLTAGFGALGVKMMDAVMLRFIEANPGCSQARIGNTLGIRRNNLVKIVAGLVEAGYVVRTQADGRTYSLQLSVSGEALVRRIKEVENETDRRFFGSCTKAERAEVERLLVGIRRISFSTSPDEAKSRFAHLCEE